MSWWEWVAGSVLLAVLLVFVPLRFRWERARIEEFGGGDIGLLKVETEDWKCDRIIARAERLGWRPLEDDRQARRKSVLLLQRSNPDAAPLPVLLKRLHRAGLLPSLPQRAELGIEDSRP